MATLSLLPAVRYVTIVIREAETEDLGGPSAARPSERGRQHHDASTLNVPAMNEPRAADAQRGPARPCRAIW